MTYNQSATEMNYLEKESISGDGVPIYTSKTIRKIGTETELFGDNNSKSFKYSVYTEKPRRIIDNDINFLLRDNKGEFLRQNYLFLISKYERILQESSNINKNIEENSKEIEKLKNDFEKLKEEKSKKQTDILNYLSNKESLEEIYKNKINYLKNQKYKIPTKLEKRNINPKLKSLKIKKHNENLSYSINEEKEIDIKIDEIKKSDKMKFNEQVISFAEEILNKKDVTELINKIKSKINIAYNIFFSEISSNSNFDENSVISQFFSRIGLYISNQSFGGYSESDMGKFLRYLLKINNINIQIFQIMKFLNKIYKEQKIEKMNQINILNKKNEVLKERKDILDKKCEKYEKIIEQNKEYINHYKQSKKNDNTEGKNQKRKFIIVSDHSFFGMGNKLNLLNKVNKLRKIEYYDTYTRKKERLDNYENILLRNENIQEYKSTDNIKEKTRKYGSKYYLKKSFDSKSKNMQNNIKNKSFKKRNSNDKIFSESVSVGNKNVTFTESSKIVKEQKGKHIMIKKPNQQEKSKTNISKEDLKIKNSNSNTLYYDDSKDVETDINSKNQSDSTLNNQNNKNDLTIKNNNKKNDKEKFMLNNYNNIQPKVIHTEKPNKIINNNIDINQNKIDRIKNNNKYKNNILGKILVKIKKEEENTNIINYTKKNINTPKNRFNGINIINNINKSETRADLCESKSSDIKISSIGNLNYYEGIYNRNNTNFNYFNSDGIKNEIYLTNTNINKNIHRVNKNTKEDEKAKKKTKYNFHNIMSDNIRSNKRVYTSYNLNINKDNISINRHSSIESNKIINENQNNLKKNIYVNNMEINRVNNSNNSKNNQIYNHYRTIKNDNIINHNDINSYNNSYKLSIYHREKEKNM